MNYVFNYLKSIPKRLLTLTIATLFAAFIIPVVLLATFVQIMFLDNN